MKHLLFVSLLLLGSTVLFAQSQMSPQGSDSNGMSGSTKTVQGCLGGSDGNYSLTADNGTMYQLTGDTSKLSAHVGHEVKITGMTGSSSSSTSTSDMSSQTLKVSSMKHIAKTCQNSGKSDSGMSH